MAIFTRLSLFHMGVSFTAVKALAIMILSIAAAASQSQVMRIL